MPRFIEVSTITGCQVLSLQYNFSLAHLVAFKFSRASDIKKWVSRVEKDIKEKKDVKDQRNSNSAAVCELLNRFNAERRRILEELFENLG